jgi:hypothetical protein
MESTNNIVNSTLAKVSFNELEITVFLNDHAKLSSQMKSIMKNAKG